MPCSHILSRIGSHRRSEGEVRHHGEPIHTHNDHVGGDKHLAEAIRQRLHHDHRHREDCLRDTGGKPQTDNLSRILLLQLQIAGFYLKKLLHLHQPQHTQQRGNCLGDHCSQRHAVDSHTHLRYEQQIQHDIDNR